MNEDLCATPIAKRRQQLSELQRTRREGKTTFSVYTKLNIKERVLVGGGHIVGGGSGSQETVAGVDSAAYNVVAGGGSVIGDGSGSDNEEVRSEISDNDVSSDAVNTAASDVAGAGRGGGAFNSRGEASVGVRWWRSWQ